MDRTKAKEYGSEGIAENHRFTPGSDRIFAVIEPGHFMHGKVNEHRYLFDASCPDGLYDSVHEHGVEQPGMIWWSEGRGHIISGTRRWIRLSASNGRRLAENLPPRSMKFEINSRWGMVEAIQKFKRANMHQLANDALTRLEAAVLEYEQGVALDDVAVSWNLKPAQIKDAERILRASDAVKEAIADGTLKLPAAFKLVTLHGTHAQQDAALAVPKAGKVKRKYLADDKRGELREIINAHLAGRPVNAERFRELANLL